MVQMCSAYGCRNRSKKNSGITFHKFPSFKKAALRKKWIFAMKRKEFDCISRSPVATELVDGHARFVSELILIWNWLAVPLFTYVSCPHFFHWRHGIKDNQLTFNSFRRDKQIIKKWPFPLLNFLGLSPQPAAGLLKIYFTAIISNQISRQKFWSRYTDVIRIKTN